MPLQTKTGTGLTMMSNLDICVSPPPIGTLGRKSSGSYGSRPLQLTCLFVPREVTFPPGESENRDKSLSLKEHALTLITGGSVQGVPLPTSAPDVEVSTQPDIVQWEGSNQPRALSLVEQQRLARLLESNPVTPVRIDRLTSVLRDYDPFLKNFLIQGFSYGFHIHYSNLRSSFESPNLISANDQPNIITDKLHKEIEAGRVAGPFSAPPFDNFVVSPLGIVPKKAPNEFRLIQHLSYPHENSVNSGIPVDFSSVRYASIQDAIVFVKRLGVGCYLAKTDIKSAFRIIPIHPEDYPLLGMKWQGNYYFDRCLPMGCRSSCAIFERFSTALEWAAKQIFQADEIIHVLDDFLLIAKSKQSCENLLSRFISLCNYLGVPIAPEKTVGPETELPFVGITLDSIRMEARLPEEKLEKCRMMLRAFYKRRKVTLRELQSLIGLLNFTCSVVLPGRAFLRRLIDLTRGIRRPHFKIRLNKHAKSDLIVWLSFLEQYNGRTFFLDERMSASRYEITSDAAGSKGYGALFNTHWFYGSWPASWQSLNITALELFPLVIALHIWGDQLADKCVTFVTDNAALVDIINKQTSKHKIVMILIRDMVLTTLKFNIFFTARHLPGKLNERADLISRFQIERFKAISPGMDEFPTPVPENLQPRNWSLS